MTTRILIGRLISIVIFCLLIFVAGGGVSFIQRPVGWLYFVLWVMWCLVAFTRQRGVPSAYDRSQRVILTALGIVDVPVLIVAPWEYANFAGPIPRDGPLAWGGLFLFALEIALMAVAVWSLHGLYTTRLGIQPGHRLVTIGPYRLMCHPGYMSHIISLTGIGLALSSLAALGLMVLSVPLILWRIEREEEMLVAEFGEEYHAYMRRTKWRLMPLVY